MNKVTPPPSVFDHEESEEETARLDALAEEDIAAGHVVANEEVMAWLRTRKPGEKYLFKVTAKKSE